MNVIREKNWSLFLGLMNARRTFRWLGSLPHIVALSSGKCPWGTSPLDRFLLVTYRCLMVAFPIVDHYRFFVMVKWITRHTQAQIRRVAFRLLCMAHIVKAIAMYRCRARLAKSGQDEGKRDAYRWQFIKASLEILCIAHVSEFPFLKAFSNEILCGASGSASCVMSLYEALPRA